MHQHDALTYLKNISKDAVTTLYGQSASNSISIIKTKPGFEGDYTVVAFPIAGRLKMHLNEITTSIGTHLLENYLEIVAFNVVKGFINITFSDAFWLKTLSKIKASPRPSPQTGQTIVLEYCGPNTNKPLHLGHIRNMVVGWSVAELLKAVGHKVHKVNIYNDRGIAICKSMVAWQLFGQNQTPENTNTKGDHFVGKFYVKYNQLEEEQSRPFLNEGLTKQQAAQQTTIFKQAQKTLKQWENGEEKTVKTWHLMNQWVYEGFNETYRYLQIDFEKNYYESETYKAGKKAVLKGLKNSTFYQQKDSSVWVDLTNAGLDQKLLLRSDGTSVYITQDIATADQRFEDFKMDKAVYVVGNEQEYHFNVLKEVLKKLNRSYANGIFHLSYGMVDLPDGKMKSREGAVVDADDLLKEMLNTAIKTTEELGKIEGFTKSEKESLHKQIALSALKFYILRVHPKKHILFNPEESIDFQGFTGPFVQYAYARIQSLLKKAGNIKPKVKEGITLKTEERNLIIHISEYVAVIREAANNYDPSHIAQYSYQLAKLLNKFWANVPVLKENDKHLKQFRLVLAHKTAETIQHSLALLGIESPKKM